MAKITYLSIRNFCKIKHVEIIPGDKPVVIRGKNGSGKSTILNSFQALIDWATLKKDQGIERPIHFGETEGKIEAKIADTVKYGNITLQRTFPTNETSYLSVYDDTGKKLNSPQEIVTSLFGKAVDITFNPIEAAKASEQELTKMIMGIIKFPKDPTTFDVERNEVYTKRTGVNSELNTAKAKLSGMWMPSGPLPDEEQSASSILTEIQGAQRINDANETKRKKLQTISDNISNANRKIIGIETQIDDLQRQKSNWELERMEAEKDFSNLKLEVKTLQDIDIQTFNEKLQSLENTNMLVRQAKTYADQKQIVETKEKESKQLTAKIAEIDKAKADNYAAAKLPVKGLTFDGTKFCYNNFSLSQAAESEKMRIALGLLIALKPELQIVFFPNNSWNLLDSERKISVLKLMNELKLVPWIEDNGEGDDGIFIEDGEVKHLKKEVVK